SVREAPRELGVELEPEELTGSSCQSWGEGAVPGPGLEHEVGGGGGQEVGDVAGDPGVPQEVLAERPPLTGVGHRAPGGAPGEPPAPVPRWLPARPSCRSGSRQAGPSRRAASGFGSVAWRRPPRARRGPAAARLGRARRLSRPRAGPRRGRPRPRAAPGR